MATNRGVYSVKVAVRYQAALDPEALKRAVKNGLVSAAFRGVELARKSTLTAPPASPNGGIGAVNTGHYRRSWRASAGAAGPRIINTAPYAAVIEHGRRPGKGVPIEPLAQWVLRKLGNEVRRQLREAGRKRTTADERLLVARGIAVNISRAIKRRGLKGRHVLQRISGELGKIASHEVKVALYIAVHGGHRRGRVL